MSAPGLNRSAGVTQGVGPAPPAERILALDVVRGFALLGILVVNVLGVSGLRALAVDESSTTEPLLREIIQIFFQGKFVSLFSTLFGISFFLQLDRLHTKGIGIFPTYWRRLGILFLMGMAHVLLAPGEVLMPYALCGAILLMFSRLPWKIVLITLALLMATPHLHTAWATANAMKQASVEVSAGNAVEPEPSEADADTQVATDEAHQPSGEVAEREILRGRSWDAYDGAEAVSVHSTGSLGEVLRYNLDFTIDRWTSSWVGYLWITFPLPLMMIGLLIGRSGFLRKVGKDPRVLLLASSVGLAAGLGLNGLSGIVGAWASVGGWNPWIGLASSLLFVFAALTLALAYGAGIFFLLEYEVPRKLLAPLGAVGQMALTNYLLQTVITVWLFWGFGLGLYGKYGAGTVETLALIIFAAQATFSIIWLRHFRFGPVEWLWRCGTYWQWVPMRASGRQ